jgi:hypothetical protein
MSKRKRKSKIEITTMIVHGIPKELKNHFKAWCARHNVSMKSQICIFFKQKIKED